MRLQALLIIAFACALSAILAPSAGATPAAFAGASGDGKAVLFTTTEKLVPGDTDTRTDVYVRAYDSSLGRYVTRQVSVGPIGGNDAYGASYNGISADGGKAFFSTVEKLVTEDHDQSEDVYVRDLDESATSLVSVADSDCATEGCVESNQAASYASAIPSGQKVFFRSIEVLDPADDDEAVDLYVRDLVSKRTRLVSVGASECAALGCGSGAFEATFRGASVDGTKVFFISEEKLVTADADALLDIYRRDIASGTTELVSISPLGACPVGADCNASYGGISSDGSHAFFETRERLSTEDIDSAQDVYAWADGSIELVSTVAGGGNGSESATFARASSDGSRVFFQTTEKLLGADTDEANDVYERIGGETALVSTGPVGGNGAKDASLEWVSPDGSGSGVLFSTGEKLTGDDGDIFQDVYLRLGTATTRVSTGPAGGNGPFNANFAGASDDGSHAFLVTLEPLVPSSDTDTAADIYEVSGGTALVSTGPLAGAASLPAALPSGAVAEDGSHAFFTTDEQVTEADLDAEADVYDRFSGGTLLASTGNAAPLGPPTPTQLSTDPGSPGTSLTPKIKGQSNPNTSIKIYASSDCSGAPVSIGDSVVLGGSGIQVTVAEGSSTTFKATATDANGDTSPCSAAVSYLHQAAAPPPPPVEEEGGGGESGGTGGTGGTGLIVGTGGTGASPGSEKKSGISKDGIVYIAPHTRITFAPASKTRARRPVFRFTDSTGQEGSSFKCKLDRSRWKGCSSPLKLQRLNLGRHLFQVKAANAVGMPELEPAKRAFKVVGR